MVYNTFLSRSSVWVGDGGANGHSCILLNPEFSGSPVLKEFLFS